MSDLADLTNAIESFTNEFDMFELRGLVDNLATHTEALDRHSSILEKMHEASQKEKTYQAEVSRGSLGPN